MEEEDAAGVAVVVDAVVATFANKSNMVTLCIPNECMWMAQPSQINKNKS